MTPEAAAWVRANAWTDHMRRGLTSPPRCACQPDPTGRDCAAAQHDRCDHGEHPDYETTIWRWGGLRPACFTKPYRHPTQADGGHRRRTAAFVWLADRTCRWICACPCRTVPARLEQLDLLDLAAVG